MENATRVTTRRAYELRDVRKNCMWSIARVLTLGSLALSAALLPACNTTEGVGKDVKSLGEGVEDAAQDAKD